MASVSPQHRFSRLMLAALGVLSLSGCTHAPANAHTQSMDSEEAATNNDPIEPVNRAIYKFNYVLDKAVLRPVASGYRAVVPQQGRTMVTHFLENIYAPVTFTNSVLQRDPQNSFATFWRFVLNSTLGVGGLFDFASAAGLHNRPADFGETLAFYQVNSGPYLMLPIIGPSNFRDAVGRLADAFINPFNYLGTPVSVSIWTATAIDARSNNMSLIDGVYSSSLDPYSTFRSGYTQKRASDIRRAEASREKELENSAVK